jgi:uncharacterized protein (DUF1684 family)
MYIVVFTAGFSHYNVQMTVRSFTCLLLASFTAMSLSYTEDVEEWRRTRETRLKADDGWLTVAGLFWLNKGSNPAGIGDKNIVQLPASTKLKNFGTFERNDEKVTFKPAAGVEASLNGTTVTEAVPMASDADGATPDLLVVGDITMFVIKRGERFGIRMRDKNSKMRREFTGLRWFPVREEYRVEAKWVAYEAPKTIEIPNILDEVEEQMSIGRAVFTLNGKEYSLEPVVEGDQLFYIFKDLTAGKETYPAGRFVYTGMPVNGKVTIDFNKAYTPPCAFTPYATCPLPPKQNRLQARIEAGELTYGHH